MMADDADVDATAGGTTRDENVDLILAALDGLDDIPVSQHAEVYLDVLDRLGGELNPEQKVRQAGAHGSP